MVKQEKPIKVNVNLPVNLEKVDSSQIEAIGYLESALTLVIKFHKGGIYTYSPVSLSRYRSLIVDESIGKYFNATIKNNPDITCEKQPQ